MASIRNEAHGKGQRLLRRWETVALVALLAFYLAPIWVFPYFPSQDGPAHLENAAILKDYHLPNHALWREYYEINPKPDPNWFGHLILAGLMYAFPATVAEKIFLSAYVILLPLSALYSLRALGSPAAFLVFLVVPFIYNRFLLMGFYNFCIGLPLHFFVIGYWLKRQDKLEIGQIVILAVLSLLLYFCHFLPWAMAVLVLGVWTLWNLLLDHLQASHVEGSRLTMIKKACLTRILPVMLAFLPALLVALNLVHSQQWLILERSTFGVKELVLMLILCLAIFFRLVSFQGRGRHLRREDGLLLTFLAVLLTYFVMPGHLMIILPNSSGLGVPVFIKERLSIFIFFWLSFGSGLFLFGRPWQMALRCRPWRWRLSSWS